MNNYHISLFFIFCDTDYLEEQEPEARDHRRFLRVRGEWRVQRQSPRQQSPLRSRHQKRAETSRRRVRVPSEHARGDEHQHSAQRHRYVTLIGEINAKPS